MIVLAIGGVLLFLITALSCLIYSRRSKSKTLNHVQPVKKPVTTLAKQKSIVKTVEDAPVDSHFSLSAFGGHTTNPNLATFESDVSQTNIFGKTAESKVA